MKTFSKKISAVLLSVYMVFGVVSTDYLTVQAFEWVVPSLTVGDSILWLMGLLGITYTEGASAWRDVSPEYEQDFIDYANEHGMTYEQTSTWLNDTASGKLNQLSNVWSTFKEWVKSKFASTSVSDNNTYVGKSIFDCVSLFNSTYNASYSLPSTVDANRVVSGVVIRYQDNYPNLCIFLSRSDNPSYSISLDYPSNYPNGAYTLHSSANLYGFYSGVISKNDPRGIFSPENHSEYVLEGFPIDANTSFFFQNVSDLTGDFGVADSEVDVYNPALIPDINFADSNTEDASIPGVIDLPWGNLGDDEAERDKTYDDLVGGLDLGKEIGDLWQALQDLMGVLAVDDAGVLQPNSGGENPPTLEDEVENNKVNGAFVLTGLQKVFPFCIPFDLYAFITLLEAPPVAPVIRYPIYNPVTKSNEIITIDFSTWESVVILFRYIFDFLFIIGLLLMARALIGGGDSA